MEFTGKSVEEAIETGLKATGFSKETADIKVISEAVKGLFGKIKKEAVVEITEKKEEKPQAKTEKKAVNNGEGIDNAVKFLEELSALMGYTVKVKKNFDGENQVLTIISDDSSSVIGYRGEALDAMQTLAGAIANIGNKEYKKVVVDCENYREKREDALINLAHKLEKKATEMRRDVILEPMSPFERRIIHTALAESETVKTSSEGKEPNRYVVITPFDKDESLRPYNAGLNRRNDNRRGRNGKNHGRGSDFKGRRQSGRGGEEKRKSPTVFGTYLGNSLKDKND